MTRRRLPSHLAVLAGLLCAALAAPAAAAPPRVRVSGGLSVGYDSNVGASQDGFEKEDSTFTSMLLAGDYMWVGTDYFAVMLRGQINGDVYDRFENLSNGKAMAMLRATVKPGGGFFVPVLSVWGSAGRLEYGSRIRTGDEFRGGLLSTLQLTTQVGLRAEIKGFHRRAEGRVFDQSGQAAVLGLNWGPTPRLMISTNFEYQTGDSFSTAAPTLRVLQAAEEIEPDDAFGGTARSQFAYRFDARTLIGTAGFNYRLTRDLALDGQLQGVDVNADFGNEYQRLTALVGLLMRF